MDPHPDQSGVKNCPVIWRKKYRYSLTNTVGQLSSISLGLRDFGVSMNVVVHALVCSVPRTNRKQVQEAMLPIKLTLHQGRGSVFILNGSGPEFISYESGILGWITIRIHSRFRVLMTKNLKKKKTVEKTLSSKLNPDQEPCFARKGEFYGHALTTRFWGIKI